MRRPELRFSGRVCFCFIVLLLSILSTQAAAQFETATVSGRVIDPSGLSVAGARVKLVDIDRGTTNTTVTNISGLYAFPNVRPGRYLMQVDAQGFKTVNVTGLGINTQANLEQNFRLQVGSISESLTVEASSSPDLSGAVGTTVGQKLVQDIPLNGRSFQTLFQLTPGTVVANTSYAEQGQFSVNGQRTAANYVQVDGASANVGIAAATSPGQSMAGALPALTASGGTNSLVSVNALQEFRIQTSTYAPEFGRSPGAQVSIVTRSGTNQLHGTAFDYVRNDMFDANDWFAKRNGLPRAQLRQNDFGGVIGGPIIRDATFFFFSYEGLRLRQPTTTLTDVPTLAARQSAIPAMQPFLNAFPAPTGSDEGNGLAPANYAYSNPSRLDATSVRIDQKVATNLMLFGRYNNAPSNFGVRGGGGNGLSTVQLVDFGLQTLTLGANYLRSISLANEFRFNLSWASSSAKYVPDAFGGAQPVPLSSVIPSTQPLSTSEFQLYIDSGVSTVFSSGLQARNHQRQLNIIDSISVQQGAHSLKVGVDFRRLTPTTTNNTYYQSPDFPDIPSAQAGDLSSGFGEVLAFAGPVRSTYDNYSVFGQDTWRVRARLLLTYGLRWEFNPTPSGEGQNGLAPAVAANLGALSKASIAPSNAPFYHAPASNFAPRLGLSYAIDNSEQWQTTLKSGFGIFYDLGNGPVGYAFSYSPFTAVSFPSSTFPFSSSDATPPVFQPSGPYITQVVAFPYTLKLPYTYEWNLSVDQSLRTNQSLTLGYVGAAGRRLLRLDSIRGSVVPAVFSGGLLFINNLAESNYDAFQAQFMRRQSHGLQILASYSWAHSLDNGSTNTNNSVPSAQVSPSIDYGPSDFDIRHTGSLALNYDVPLLASRGLARSFLSGWSVSTLFLARTASPVDVTVRRNAGFGTLSYRPDRVVGTPLYINDPIAPGGRELNPGAVVVPSDLRQGDLGRNAFRGFSVVQQDFSVRRRFRVTERCGIEFIAEAFNVWNHPNFASPSGSLGRFTSHLIPSSSFGTSQSMFGTGTTTGSFGSGFSPLYQVGGPRSLQLSLKLEL